MCVQMGRGAEHYIRTGRAREITREQALEIIQRAEENGLMHDMVNIEEPGESAAICNCCACACFGLRVGLMYGARDAIRSNYVAEVDEAKCVACGQCVETCPGNALKLGQKRCTTDPHISDTYDTDVSVPYDLRSYDPEFRTNRSDVMPSGTAPCKAVCPLNIPVQGCLQLLSAGRYDDAAALIRQATPFPELCGSVCGRQCEKVCTRNQIDTAVGNVAVEQHNRQTSRCRGDRLVIASAGVDDQAVHAGIDKPGERLRFLSGVVAANGRHERAAARGGAGGKSFEHGARERVGDVGQDHADEVGARAAQIACGGTWAIAGALDNRRDASTGFLGHLPGAVVEIARDRGRAHARLGGNVLDSHLRHSAPRFPMSAV